MTAPFAAAIGRIVGLLDRARAGRVADRRLELARLSSRVLSRSASVHVVRWNGEELLVGCTDQSMVVLSRHPVDSTGVEVT